ncbi:E3 ubiquitin-protein ligase FANCL isoform X3 [Olea europaea var. sylvestris]|uniref:E3 ubiquitin-protein ligase FANCL isoform X3 n=1 Tax=Olea europaea var. sylvestris TaxID=158386 RepID=UPI000C1CEABB|nr:E3 ubiquitin-protein ligase FANCL isoform X3 [Olea europaea var. sylvestris]
MNVSMVKEYSGESRRLELAKSSAFYRRIYSEVEEIGWERLLKLQDDLTSLSFRLMDKKGRAHILEITLDKTYPKCPPAVSADVPYNFNLEWPRNSSLRDVVRQFQEHMDKLQDFWSTLDDIDRSLWVTNPKQPDLATSYRQINIGNDCYIMLSINASDPRALPECRFMGAYPKVNLLREIWRRRCKLWTKDKPFPINLACVLGIQLPQAQPVQKNEEQIECGICYAQNLPLDDELGTKSGSETDYKCENANCNRAFHSICLGDWLRSITTTRNFHGIRARFIHLAIYGRISGQQHGVSHVRRPAS